MLRCVERTDLSLIRDQGPSPRRPRADGGNRITWFALPFLLAGAMSIGRAQEATNEETPPEIAVPADGDEYSDLVRRAQAGQKVDFRRLRISYLGSKAQARAWEQQGRLDALRSELPIRSRSGEDGPGDFAARARKTAAAVLSIEYVDLEAHRLMRHACKALGDAKCESLHKQIEFGMLESIAVTGNGESCRSGWEITSVPEEYFVMRALELKVKSQGLAMEEGRACDQLEAIDANGRTVARYFRVDLLLQQHDQMLKDAH